MLIKDILLAMRLLQKLAYIIHKRNEKDIRMQNVQREIILRNIFGSDLFKLIKYTI